MVEIMQHLHQYIPAVEFNKTVHLTTTGEEIEVSQSLLRKILLGGDQLTAARARGAKRARANSLSSVTRLEGIEPTASDFHVFLNMLDVSFMLLIIMDGVMILLCRLLGSTSTPLIQQESLEQCTISVM